MPCFHAALRFVMLWVLVIRYWRYFIHGGFYATSFDSDLRRGVAVEPRYDCRSASDRRWRQLFLPSLRERMRPQGRDRQWLQQLVQQGDDGTKERGAVQGIIVRVRL